MKSIIFHIAFPVRLTWELISLGGLAVGAARREAGSHLQWFGLRGTSRGGGHVAYPTAAWNRLQQVLTTHQPDIQSPWKHTLKLYTIQQINKTNLHITHIKLIRFNFNFLFTRTLHNDTITSANMQTVFSSPAEGSWGQRQSSCCTTLWWSLLICFLKFFNSPLIGSSVSPGSKD